MKAVRTIELEQTEEGGIRCTIGKGQILKCVQRRLKDIEVFLADSGEKLKEAYRNENKVVISMKIEVAPGESSSQYDTAWDVKFPLDRVHAGGKEVVTPNQRGLPLR